MAELLRIRRQQLLGDKSAWGSDTSWTFGRGESSWRLIWAETGTICCLSHTDRTRITEDVLNLRRVVCSGPTTVKEEPFICWVSLLTTFPPPSWNHDLLCCTGSADWPGSSSSPPESLPDQASRFKAGQEGFGGGGSEPFRTSPGNWTQLETSRCSFKC